jgi:aminoglycoside phosphotransferase (APT) family kinase protein
VPAVERRTEILQLTRLQIQGAIEHVLPRTTVTAHRLADQGRANTNYIVETDRGRYVLRVYVREGEACAKERALHELVGGRVPVARIWGSGDAQQGLGHPFSVLDFVPGVSLEALAARGERAPLLHAARALGTILAELTSFRFDQFADLRADSTGHLQTVAWPFGDFYRFCLFESPAAVRLGPLRDRLWALLERQQGRFSDPLPFHLTHGDFNPSNLLVRDDGQVAAVLDWEFAHAGKVWQDLGNLLRERPELTLPSGFEAALADGFSERGVQLPPDWRAHAEFDDLSNACDFLSSVEEKPETHTRALRQISHLLERYAS